MSEPIGPYHKILILEKQLEIARETLEAVRLFHIHHLKEPERTIFWMVVDAKKKMEAVR